MGSHFALPSPQITKCTCLLPLPSSGVPISTDALLGFFPLLKSSEKLYAQDSIWKNICKELGWEFIRSI